MVSWHRPSGKGGIRTRKRDVMEWRHVAKAKVGKPLSSEANGCVGLRSGESDNHVSYGRMIGHPPFNAYISGFDVIGEEWAQAY